MATELLRDKRANVENQLNQEKIHLFLCEIQVTLADDEREDTDDLTKAAYINLRNEAQVAKVNVISLRRKITVLQPVFDALDKELKSEEASKA